MIANRDDMPDKLQAQHAFWSGFSWPAYDESSVPDGAKFPYITYEAGDFFFEDGERQLSASLWTRSTSWSSVIAKSQEIADAIDRGSGICLPCKGGNLRIYRGTPWAQRMGDPADGSIRRIVLTIYMESNV